MGLSKLVSLMSLPSTSLIKASSPLWHGIARRKGQSFVSGVSQKGLPGLVQGIQPGTLVQGSVHRALRAMSGNALSTGFELESWPNARPGPFCLAR